MRKVTAVSLLFACVLASHCDAATTSDIPDASDAAAAIDAAPSDDSAVDAAITYPAAHPAAPTIKSVGGPIIATPHVIPIVFENDPLASTIGAFTKALHGTSYWKATTSEYGIGDITSDDVVTIPATDTVPGATIDDTAIQAFLVAHLDGAHAGFGAPDASTVYALFYPSGTTITKGPETSCSTFGGYHRSVSAGGVRVAYTVVPRCAGFAFVKGTDAVTAPASHELIEAVTDPFEATAPAYLVPDDDHIAYGFYPGTEVGDMCAGEQDSYYEDPDVGFVVQRSWSNVVAAAGGSGCAPLLANDVYFGASPVLGEKVNVDLSSEGMGTIVTKGVIVKLGETKTIDVDVFSTAPKNAFDLFAFDFPTMQSQPAELQFTFDKVAGANGDTRQLTIKRLANAKMYGGTPFVILAYTNEQDGHPIVGFVGQ
jgi:hypothetical protein